MILRLNKKYQGRLSHNVHTVNVNITFYKIQIIEYKMNFNFTKVANAY